MMIEEAAYAIWMGEGEDDRREEASSPEDPPEDHPDGSSEGDLWDEWRREREDIDEGWKELSD